MLNVVWYSPFIDGSFKADVDKHVKSCIARKHDKPKAYHGIQAELRVDGQLRRFGKRLRLYVIGHGDMNSDYLVGEPSTMAACGMNMHVSGYSNHFNKLALTPQQLCDRLLSEDPDPRAEVRLWACIGARGSNNYAKEFAKLYCHWRPAARVFGYTGYLLLAGGHKRGQIINDDSLDSQPASNFMVEVTPKPSISADDSDGDEAPAELIWNTVNWNYPGQAQ